MYTPSFKDALFPSQHLSSDNYGAVYTTGLQPLDATATSVPTGAALPPIVPPDLLPQPFRPAKAKAGEAPAAVCRALPQEHVSGKRAGPHVRGMRQAVKKGAWRLSWAPGQAWAG